MNNYEVYTMTDKQKRDEMFEDFRKDGSPQERKAVKFSSNEPVLGADGEPLVLGRSYTATGKGGIINFGKTQLRPVYRSTWSVAYPRETR
jgi:hypothetical protein